MLSGYIEIRDAAERTRQKQLVIEAAPIESMERAQTKEPVGVFVLTKGPVSALTRINSGNTWD